MTKRLSGLFTAIVTPFDGNGYIDYDAFNKLLDMQLDARVDGVVLLGTTGESPTLSCSEKEELLKYAVVKLKGKTKIIVGSGSNCTNSSIKLSGKAEELGADALMLVNPYYNKPTQQGMFEHFDAIAKSVSIPIMLYNIKGRTVVNLNTDTLFELVAANNNIIAVKEASGDVAQFMDVVYTKNHLFKDREFAVLTGDDAFCFPSMALGGQGVVSVIGNIFPHKMRQLVDYMAKGEYNAARELHYKMFRLMSSLLSIGANPMAVKYLLSRIGLIENRLRLPLCHLEGTLCSELNVFYDELAAE